MAAEILPGKVLRVGDELFSSDACMSLTIAQALHFAPTGENLLWTTHVDKELPIKLASSGAGAVRPVTCREAWARRLQVSGHEPALAFKHCCYFAKALITLGHSLRDRVILMGTGHPAWHIAHFGTILADGVACSIYPTTTARSVALLLAKSSAVAAVVDTLENFSKIREAICQGDCPNLAHIILYKDLPPSETWLQRMEEETKTHIWPWYRVLRLGKDASNEAFLEERLQRQTPGTCCAIVFTSGTTGVPKGAMLSHDNCLWTSYALVQGMEAMKQSRPGQQQCMSQISLWNFMSDSIRFVNEQAYEIFIRWFKGLLPAAADVETPRLHDKLDDEDMTPLCCASTLKACDTSGDILNMRTPSFAKGGRGISYLPLSHIAAQICDIYQPLLLGHCTYFAEADALRGSLAKTLVEVRPTFMVGVPRVYEKIEEKTQASLRHMNSMAKFFFEWARVRVASGTLATLLGHRPPLLYRFLRTLFWKWLHSALGLDMCEVLVSSAAPLQARTGDFFLSLGLPLCNVYGMTESSGPLTANAALPCWYRPQTAGLALPGTELYIDQARGMETRRDSLPLRPTARSAVGEICTRGRHVFMGYFLDEDATRETLDVQGFLHSGDLGHIDCDGYLRITGRCKELLVTSGGENVAPVPIENLVKEEMPFVANCMVLCDQRKFLSLLLTLKSSVSDDGTWIVDPSSLNVVNEGKPALPLTTRDAIHCPSLHAMIRDALERVNRRVPSRAQRVVDYRILEEDFTVSGGELTPTLKARREFVLSKYRDVIDSMYTSAATS